jgi:hypothetical protein
MKGLIESANLGYYWQAKDGKALKSIITKIKFRWRNKHGTEAGDQQVTDSFEWVLKNLPEWYRDKWDTCTIESKFESIIKQIHENNGKPKQQNADTTPAENGISPRLGRTWKLIAEHYQADPT